MFPPFFLTKSRFWTRMLEGCFMLTLSCNNDDFYSWFTLWLPLVQLYVFKSLFCVTRKKMLQMTAKILRTVADESCIDPQTNKQFHQRLSVCSPEATWTQVVHLLSLQPLSCPCRGLDVPSPPPPPHPCMCPVQHACCSSISCVWSSAFYHVPDGNRRTNQRAASRCRTKTKQFTSRCQRSFHANFSWSLRITGDNSKIYIRRWKKLVSSQQIKHSARHCTSKREMLWRENTIQKENIHYFFFLFFFSNAELR